MNESGIADMGFVSCGSVCGVSTARKCRTGIRKFQIVRLHFLLWNPLPTEWTSDLEAPEIIRRMDTRAAPLQPVAPGVPLSQRLIGRWWRRQTPARQDRFATLAPLVSVLLF